LFRGLCKGEAFCKSKFFSRILPEGVEIVIQKICSDQQNPILPLRTQQVSCLLQLILPFRMKGVMATGNRKKKLEQMSFPNEKNRNFLRLSMIIGMIFI
jgi:hypothetical protein